MTDFGTYTVKVTDDGRGVEFSAKPSPFAITSLIVFIMFPPYTLLLFMSFHVLLRNKYVIDKCDPMIKGFFATVFHGGKMVVKSAQEFINDITADAPDETYEAYYSDIPEMDEVEEVESEPSSEKESAGLESNDEESTENNDVEDNIIEVPKARSNVWEMHGTEDTSRPWTSEVSSDKDSNKGAAQ